MVLVLNLGPRDMTHTGDLSVTDELRRKAEAISREFTAELGETRTIQLADAIEAALRERDYEWWKELCMVDAVAHEPEAVHRFVLLMQEEAVAEELEAQTTILKELQKRGFVSKTLSGEEPNVEYSVTERLRQLERAELLVDGFAKGSIWHKSSSGDDTGWHYILDRGEGPTSGTVYLGNGPVPVLTDETEAALKRMKDGAQ
jgi:hypothetical protein